MTKNYQTFLHEVEAPVEKKKPGPKPKIANMLTEADVLGLLQAASGIAYGATQAKHGELWLVSEAELQSVAKPLTNVLNRLPIAKDVQKYSDPIALIVAVGAIIVPRVLISHANIQTTAKAESDAKESLPVEPLGNANEEPPGFFTLDRVSVLD